MNRTLKIYLVLLLLIIIGSVIFEFSKPRPIDWTPTYNETHKIPYGTYVLFNELPELFPKDSIEKVYETPYQFLKKNYRWVDSTYSVSGTFIYINERFNMDPESTNELLNFAKKGNTIFISAKFFQKSFLDSLGMDTGYEFKIKSESQLRFTNSNLASDSITIKKGVENYYFKKLDSATTTVLGYQKFDDTQYINFVKVAVDSGTVYVHTQPLTFTNYQLLKNNHKKYAAAALSYLPDRTIYFDSKNKTGVIAGSSPLRFILSKPPLRWAWYLALISLICFMIFNAKRRQRVIRIIKPLQNTTVAFTKTIGNLYYETKDHNAIIQKKITYFFEYLRRTYFLDTQILDDKFVKNLSLKANKKPETVQYLVNVIRQLRNKRLCTEGDVLRLNSAIENFYNK